MGFRASAPSPTGPSYGVIDAFEAAYARVEAEDFDKLGRFASMKGSGPDRATDDRSSLRVIF